MNYDNNTNQELSIVNTATGFNALLSSVSSNLDDRFTISGDYNIYREPEEGEPLNFRGHSIEMYDVNGRGYTANEILVYDPQLNRVEWQEEMTKAKDIAEATIAYEANQTLLKDLYEKSFTKLVDDEWNIPGSFTQSHIAEIRPNIRNGVYAQSMRLAAFLGTFTPRKWRIDARIKGLKNVNPGLFSVTVGAPNHGKSPICDSLGAISGAIYAIDSDRVKLTKALFKRNAEDQKSTTDAYVLNTFYKGGNSQVAIANVTIAMLMKCIGIQDEIDRMVNLENSQYSDLATDLPSRTSILESADGGQLLERFYKKSSISEPSELIFTSISTGDKIDHARSTDDIKVVIDQPRMSISVFCQPQYYQMMMQSESHSEDGFSNDKGLTYRFTPINIFNTEAVEKDVVLEADDSLSMAQLMNVGVKSVTNRMNVFSLLIGRSEALSISIKDDARDFLVSAMNDLFAETQSLRMSGWASNMATKMQSSVVKAAWDMQMLEMFNSPMLDGIDFNSTIDTKLVIDPVIGIEAVRRAVEHVRCSFYAAVYYAKKAEMVRALEMKEKELAVPSRILEDKLVRRFLDPGLLDKWVSKAGNMTAVEIYKNKLNNDSRKKLKDSSLDPIKLIEESLKRIQ